MLSEERVEKAVAVVVTVSAVAAACRRRRRPPGEPLRGGNEGDDPERIITVMARIYREDRRGEGGEAQEVDAGCARG